VVGPAIDANSYAAGFAITSGFATLAAVIAVSSFAGLTRAVARAAEADEADNAAGERETIFE
jgi:hypothetical protein